MQYRDELHRSGDGLVLCDGSAHFVELEHYCVLLVHLAQQNRGDNLQGGDGTRWVNEGICGQLLQGSSLRGTSPEDSNIYLIITIILIILMMIIRRSLQSLPAHHWKARTLATDTDEGREL